MCPAAPDAPGGGVPVIRGVVSTTVPDSEHKVYLGGIPTALNEMQVPHPHTSSNLTRGVQRDFIYR